MKRLLLAALAAPWLLLKLLIRKFRFSIHRGTSDKKVASLNGVKFEYDFAYSPYLKKMYFGLYEPFLVHALNRFLHQGDLFIDVGSNIGYLTALGAGRVGKNGGVYSFEPSQREFERLKRLAALNREYDIQCFNVACGDRESELEMNISSAFGWNTLVPNWMRNDVYEKTVKVNVVPLGDFLLKRIHLPERIKLIKIDVEGYEYYVLKGLLKLFQVARPPIVCEITPRGNAFLGIKLEAIDSLMKENGYQPAYLINPRFSMDLKNLTHQEDVLFLPKSSF